MPCRTLAKSSDGTSATAFFMCPSFANLLAVTVDGGQCPLHFTLIIWCRNIQRTGFGSALEASLSPGRGKREGQEGGSWWPVVAGGSGQRVSWWRSASCWQCAIS